MIRIAGAIFRISRVVASILENKMAPPLSELCAKTNGRSVLLVAGDPAEVGGQVTLGYGDLLRVLALVPNMGAGRVGWCSPPSLFPIVKDCIALSELILREDLWQRRLDFDFVINLSSQQLEAGQETFGIFDFIDAEGNMKQQLDRLPDLLGRELGFAPTPFMPLAPPPADAEFDFGFNTFVPAAWSIKELPTAHWQAIASILGSSRKITWQPETSDLSEYVGWVKSCRVLISIIGLGCHIAELYGIPLVVLAGPTDYPEAHVNSRVRGMVPPMKCEHRPCFLPAGVNDCGCMGDFSPETIARMAETLFEATR